MDKELMDLLDSFLEPSSDKTYIVTEENKEQKEIEECFREFGRDTVYRACKNLKEEDALRKKILRCANYLLDESSYKSRMVNLFWVDLLELSGLDRPQGMRISEKAV